MKISRTSLAGLAAGNTANAAALPAIACPQVHVIAARETTAPPGFGSAKALVDLVTTAFPGATAEAIDYPAAGGDNGEYAQSVTDGIIGVLAQTRVFQMGCPNSVIVMHGYSQGAQIIDDAFCGGPDGTSLAATSSLVDQGLVDMVAAIIMMGNPRHVPGLLFNVGNATAQGFAARPANFTCPTFEDRIQSYCDSPDPFCANGTDAQFHQGYGERNGAQALEFIRSKLLVS